MTNSKAAKGKTTTTKTPVASARKKSQRKATPSAAPKNATQQKAKLEHAPLRENSKLASIIALLHRKEGATIEQLMKATGWQPHSLRGALSGALKKKLGLKITSAKADGVRTYRVVG